MAFFYCGHAVARNLESKSFARDGDVVVPISRKLQWYEQGVPSLLSVRLSLSCCVRRQRYCHLKRLQSFCDSHRVRRFLPIVRTGATIRALLKMSFCRYRFRMLCSTWTLKSLPAFFSATDMRQLRGCGVFSRYGKRSSPILLILSCSPPTSMPIGVTLSITEEDRRRVRGRSHPQRGSEAFTKQARKREGQALAYPGGQTLVPSNMEHWDRGRYRPDYQPNSRPGHTSRRRAFLPVRLRR